MPNKIGVSSKESETVFNAETLKILQGPVISYVVSTLQLSPQVVCGVYLRVLRWIF